VGDAGDHLAHRGHASHVRQLELQLLLGQLGGFEFRGVGHKRQQPARRKPHRTQASPEQRAVFAPQLELLACLGVLDGPFQQLLAERIGRGKQVTQRQSLKLLLRVTEHRASRGVDFQVLAGFIHHEHGQRRVFNVGAEFGLARAERFFGAALLGHVATVNGEACHPPLQIAHRPRHAFQLPLIVHLLEMYRPAGA